MVKARALLVLLLVAGLLVPTTACGKKRLDPEDPGSIPSSGDDSARTRFEEARARFERDELDAAYEEFEAIVREYPDDPVAPFARLYAGMAAFRRGEHQAARALLEPLAADPATPEAVATRARLFLGLTSVYLGQWERTVELLEPFDGKLQPGEGEIERRAALAEAYTQLGQTARALPHYDAFHAGGRPAEKAYVEARVATLVGGLTEDQARAAYDSLSNRDGPSGRALGLRLGLVNRDPGEGASARSDVIGALLPFSGRARLVGEAALRGLSLFAYAVGQGAQPGEGFQIELRDTGGATPVRELVDELAARGVIAVVGPVDGRAAEEAGRRATELGLPLVSLDVAPDAALASPYGYAIALPVEQRARALARRAIKQGAKRFAMLAPDISYGRAATAAFQEEVTRLGGQVVILKTYDRAATSFVAPVKEVAGQKFDALFIADTAARLQLLAPQLAVFDLIVYAPGTEPPKFKRDDKGRRVPVKPIILLSTAEGLSPDFLASTGRYAEGALLAPGFYPDDADDRIAPYVERFRQAYGRAPSYLDAYAHDAALLVAAAVNAGARSRAELAPLLGRGGVVGLTGAIQFDTSHRRSDDGILFTVVGEMPVVDPAAPPPPPGTPPPARVLAIRAL